MLVALLPWLVGCTRGALGLSLSGRSLGLCQPLTTLQLEAPSSQWDDSLEIKTQPTGSSQELVTVIHSQSSVAIQLSIPLFLKHFCFARLNA